MKHVCAEWSIAMKCLVKIIIAFSVFLFIPSIASASWQVAKPQTSIPSEPFFQAGSEQNDPHFVPHYGVDAFPNHYTTPGGQSQMYAISVSGSLKENIERIMDRYHWRVLWQAPYDYNFDGRVAGANLPDVIRKLLKPFPLQAQMYMSNRTMIVVQRKP